VQSQDKILKLKKLEFLVRTGAQTSDGFEAAPPGVRSHVAGV
jgi:hypothetical protein